MPPLPPIPMADWLAFRARAFREAGEAAIDALGWQFRARGLIDGLPPPTPPPAPAPAPAPPEPEPVFEPPPPPWGDTPWGDTPPSGAQPAPPRSPVQALGARIGSTRSGIGERASLALSGAQEALTGGVQAAQQTGTSWVDEARAQIAGLGQPAALKGLTPRVVPDATQPGGERVELGGATRYLPLPPALEGLRPGLEGYGEEVATAGRFVATRPGEVLRAGGALSQFTPVRLPETAHRLATGRTTPGRLGAEALEALPAAGAVATLAPIPAWQAGNLVANAVEEPLLRQGVHPALAGAAGLAADVLTPSPGDVPRLGARVPLGRLPGMADDLADLVRSVPYRFGQAAAEELPDAALGIRRGQRFRMPALTPEEQAQRALDRAADERVLEAIRALWRRGPAGEDAADELRLLALGKGEAGEAAAQEVLAARGLEDVLPPALVPPPAAAGVVAGEAADGAPRLLGLARRATEPLGARAALTGGERAFDLAAGTAGGIAGAATADEDATWQERLGRGALGASLGALGGANARQLGRIGARALGDGTTIDDLGELGALGARGGGRRRTPKVTPGGLIGDIATVTTGLGLANLASLGSNLTGGVLRTATRVARELAGETGNPMDAFTDLAGMGAELPGLFARFFREFAQGPSQAGQQLVGQRVGGRDLTRSRNPLAMLATTGTRANAATDEVIGALNEAGARAVALKRGQNPDQAAKRAGEFATYRNGVSSPIADLLSKGGSWLSDPTKSAGTRLLGGLFYTFAPYVRMPERLLLESLRTITDPATQALPLVQAIRKGDAAAVRQARARMIVGAATSATLYSLWDSGNLTGEPPSNPTERRRREAEGAQWNTLRVGGVPVPLRVLGDLGQTASLLASSLERGQEAIEAGEDPGEIATAVGNEVLKWTLSESYLRDLAKLGSETLQGRGVEELQRAGARVASRPLAPLAPLTAVDPVERETQGFLPTVQSRVPGLRNLLPERIDPATGEALPRRGSGLTRALGMDFGPGQTETARELARYGVTARELRAGDEYAGMPQTSEQARTIQRALGSETGRLVRELVATPAYRQADDTGKERLLRRALSQAADEADIAAGEGVARDAKRQAQRAWDALPKFEGVKGSPDEIRRENARVRRAKSAVSEARGADPRNGERRFREEHPEQYRLAQRQAIDPGDLRARREAIERQYGVTLS